MHGVNPVTRTGGLIPVASRPCPTRHPSAVERVVDLVGDGVTTVRFGDRVYTSGTAQRFYDGAYLEREVLLRPAWQVSIHCHLSVFVLAAWARPINPPYADSLPAPSSSGTRIKMNRFSVPRREWRRPALRPCILGPPAQSVPASATAGTDCGVALVAASKAQITSSITLQPDYRENVDG